MRANRTDVETVICYLHRRMSMSTHTIGKVLMTLCEFGRFLWSQRFWCRSVSLISEVVKQCEDALNEGKCASQEVGWRCPVCVIPTLLSSVGMRCKVVVMGSITIMRSICYPYFNHRRFSLNGYEESLPVFSLVYHCIPAQKNSLKI